jgi:nitrite transporter NirC
MYSNTIDQLSELASKKAMLIRRSPLGFFIGSMMAGAYVGFGIILVFSIAAGLDPSVQKPAMGVSFGVALTLVVFAGAELFTGHTMYMTLGWLTKRTSAKDLAASWSLTWLGNLVGAFTLAFIFYLGGGGVLLNAGSDLLYDITDAKMNGSAISLLAKGILCNWLVCLALWMAARTTNDTAKCIVIFWALYAFIASGFEHSVANMTLFCIALLGNHPETISIAGMGHNLLWVTIGNIISGSLFMATAYWYATIAPAKS